ncbi:site-specific integrase [Candidatus Woesebacteria bacterium]|nr:site-specific integrase [Candidatus Woesebacteria bacterium]
MNEYIDFLKNQGFKKKWNDNSLHKEVQNIQAFTKYLYSERIIDRDWGLRLMKPKTFIPLHAHMEKSEALKFIKLATTPGPRDHKLHRESKNGHYWALMFIAASGLRNFEVRQLKVKHLNFINENEVEAIVPKAKVGNPKLTPISRWPDLTEELKTRVRQRDPEEKLFKVTKWRLGKIMLKAKKLGKVPDSFKFSVHTLRSIYATDLYEAGADIETIRILMDHKDIETTKRYIQHSPFFKREMLDRFESRSQRYLSDEERVKKLIEEAQKLGIVLEHKIERSDTVSFKIKV